jgi:hypothetical protein
MGEAVNLAGVLVGICAAAGGGVACVVSHVRRLAVLEAQYAHLAEWLGRVETKLDRVIEQRP